MLYKEPHYFEAVKTSEQEHHLHSQQENVKISETKTCRSEKRSRKSAIIIEPKYPFLNK